MTFSGRVNSMTNGEWREHQYRVDKRALYIHQLTVWICLWKLCNFECIIAHDGHIYLLRVATHQLPISQFVASHHMQIQIDVVGR
jgi:hypothetical protein